MSLRLKTILGIAFIEAVLLLILINTVLNHMRQSASQGLYEYASTTSMLFSTTNKDAVISFDLASIETFVSEIMKNKDIIYARVLDSSGNVLAQDATPAYITTPFIADDDPFAVTDGVYDTFAEIKEGKTVFGRVELGISTIKMTEKVRQVRNLGASIALIEMTIVMLYSFVLGGYITRQLHTLRHGAKEIAKGNFNHRIKIVSKDEVAEVAKSFNKMSQALLVTAKARKKAQKELRVLNHELEDRVKRRTAQLEKAYLKIKKAQEQLIQSEKMASIGQLAAGVAHEINNPIGFVASNLSTLQDYIAVYKTLISRYEDLIIQVPLNKSQQTQLDAIKAYQKEEDIEFLHEDIDELIVNSLDGINRVTSIVQSLKTFSHVDQSQLQEADINQCLQSTLKIVHNEIKYNCEVITKLNPLPPLRCKPGQLNQVFMNLLVNAGHAIEKTGTITIETKTIQKAIVIKISDTGKGIPKENLNKLFDPFFTTKPVGKGTGLGLSISHGIIADHNGTINVQSKVGQGTTFTITLPLNHNLPQVSKG